MFSGNPFDNIFGQFHRRQMHEMDQMMNDMMDPFGLLGRHSMFGGMIEDAPNRHRPHPAHRDDMALMNPFGGGIFGGMMRQMEDMQSRALNDPNSHVFSHSTMITYDGRQGGQPRIVENSIRKTGDVKELRHAIRTGDQRGVGDKMTISHTIGDRAHVIEKKRNREGKIKQRQSFINLGEDEAQDFDREFTNRTWQNVARGGSSKHKAIEDQACAHSKYRNHSAQPRIGGSGVSAPIITVPDDDDEVEEIPVAPSRRGNSRGTRSGTSGGPVICEVTDDDDHHEAGNHKRRKGGLIDRLFKANEE